ncbi:MAG TPA: hypothetical protein VFL10_16965 [Ornithinibacter sp.]|nr:hypothetical protein [Ornithinibacter sp.]
MGWWSGAVGLAADVVTAAAVAMGAAVLVRTRQLSAALPVLLDLLLAAGLLRLTGSQGWASLGGTAAIIAIRKLALAGVRVGTARGGRDGGPPSRLHFIPDARATTR